MPLTLDDVLTAKVRCSSAKVVELKRKLFDQRNLKTKIDQDNPANKFDKKGKRKTEAPPKAGDPTHKQKAMKAWWELEALECRLLIAASEELREPKEAMNNRRDDLRNAEDQIKLIDLEVKYRDNPKHGDLQELREKLVGKRDEPQTERY